MFPEPVPFNDSTSSRARTSTRNKTPQRSGSRKTQSVGARNLLQSLGQARADGQRGSSVSRQSVGRIMPWELEEERRKIAQNRRPEQEALRKVVAIPRAPRAVTSRFGFSPALKEEVLSPSAMTKSLDAGDSGSRASGGPKTPQNLEDINYSTSTPAVSSRDPRNGRPRALYLENHKDAKICDADDSRHSKRSSVLSVNLASPRSAEGAGSWSALDPSGPDNMGIHVDKDALRGLRSVEQKIEDMNRRLEQLEETEGEYFSSKIFDLVNCVSMNDNHQRPSSPIPTSPVHHDAMHAALRSSSMTFNSNNNNVNALDKGNHGGEDIQERLSCLQEENDILRRILLEVEKSKAAMNISLELQKSELKRLQSEVESLAQVQSSKKARGDEHAQVVSDREARVLVELESKEREMKEERELWKAKLFAAGEERRELDEERLNEIVELEAKCETEVKKREECARRLVLNPVEIEEEMQALGVERERLKAWDEDTKQKRATLEYDRRTLGEAMEQFAAEVRRKEKHMEEKFERRNEVVHEAQGNVDVLRLSLDSHFQHVKRLQVRHELKQAMENEEMLTNEKSLDTTTNDDEEGRLIEVHKETRTGSVPATPQAQAHGDKTLHVHNNSNSNIVPPPALGTNNNTGAPPELLPRSAPTDQHPPTGGSTNAIVSTAHQDPVLERMGSFGGISNSSCSEGGSPKKMRNNTTSKVTWDSFDTWLDEMEANDKRKSTVISWRDDEDEEDEHDGSVIPNIPRLHQSVSRVTSQEEE